jgi:glutaredoxin
MRKILIVVSILSVICFFCTNGVANQIYEWTDREGVKHFTNYPPDTKEEVKATKEIPTTYVEPPVKKKKTEESSSAVVAKKKVYKKKSSRKNTVELFSTSWCTYCIQARNFLTANNIPFTEYDIEKDKSAFERKMKLSGRKGVPFAMINGKKIFGFSKGTYARVLGLQ